MAMKFVAGSSQFYKQSAPITTVRPFTAGMWLNWTTANNGQAWGIGASAGTPLWQVNDESVNHFITFSYWDGSALQGQCTLTQFTTGQWYYVIARAIANGNTRASILNPVTGGVTHASASTSWTPGALNNMTLGQGGASAPNYYNGSLAEFFFCDADIQDDGLQLSDALMRQLAFRGPFSVPNIVPKIAEYKSMRQQGDKGQHSSDDDYQRGGYRAWTPGGGVINFVQHPPLLNEYARPNERPSLLIC